MNINRYFIIFIYILLTAGGLLSCMASEDKDAMRDNPGQASAPATLDQTATVAAKVIELALSTTSTASPTASTDLHATATAEVQRLATLVAATLTAVPTITPNLFATQTAQANNTATTLTAQPTIRPTPTQDFVATQTAEAYRLATAVAATLAAQSTTPFASKQATPASVERIHFVSGSTNATFSTDLMSGIAKGFILKILAGQQMLIRVNSDVQLVVLDPDSQKLAPASTHAGNRTFTITQTGDHTLILSGTGHITISIEIPPLLTTKQPETVKPPQRIRFAAGRLSTTITVHLNENVVQAYLLGVAAKQKILIYVNHVVELHTFDPQNHELISSDSALLKREFVAPETGDYTITAKGDGDTTITIYIPPL